MKSQNILNDVLNLINEVGITLLAMLLLTCFIAALFAPAFHCILSEPITRRMAKSTDLAEQKKLHFQYKLLKIILWMIAILSWTSLIWDNSTGNLGWLIHN